jgi:hypothetical protein
VQQAARRNCATRSSRRRAISRATCRGTQTCGVGEVVDDESRDDPRDEPCDVPRHPDARRRRSSRRRAVRRAACCAEAPGCAAEAK